MSGYSGVVASQDVYVNSATPFSIIGSGGGGGGSNFDVASISSLSVSSINGALPTNAIPQELTVSTLTLRNAITPFIIQDADGAPYIEILGSLIDGVKSYSLETDAAGGMYLQGACVSTLGIGDGPGKIDLNSGSLTTISSISQAAGGVNFSGGAIENISSINGYDAQSFAYSFRVNPVNDLSVPANSLGAVSSLMIAPFPVVANSEYQISGQAYVRMDPLSTNFPPGGAWGAVTAKLRFPINQVGNTYQWIDTGICYNDVSTLRGGGLTNLAGAFNFNGTFTAGALLTSTFAHLVVPTNTGGPAFTYQISSFYGNPGNAAYPIGWNVTDLGTIYPTPPLV